MFKRLKRLLLGEPLSNFQAAHEQIPKWKALSTLSSDALSSVAYATDAILFTLTAFSVSAIAWSIPVAACIAVLLLILTLSYLQTIDAYPLGGGAYTVAKENLGQQAGLIAGAALLIDYILTVSVSVASGVENIASAFPFLLHHKESICAIVIIIIMFMNLRGIRESATAFAFPAYLFIFSVVVLLGTGLWRYLNGSLPSPIPSEIPTTTMAAIPMILFLRAFASGCSALTGVEAISNCIPVFQAPQQKNAKITLIMMSCILGFLFFGITGLAHILKIVPHPNETLISLLGHAVFSNSLFYYVLQVATALILFLAANTSYAGFPPLASLLANDRFLPRQLGSLGDRLVFSNAILGLSTIAMLLILLFKGEAQQLLPLYAVGVFLSFTLSQAGMVMHHIRIKEPRWFGSLILNFIGAVTTFVVLCDITFTKFLSGAWMVVLTIPILVLLFRKIHKHYMAVGQELSLVGITPQPLHHYKNTVIIPISGLHQGVLQAAEYALSISNDVRACYVELDARATESLKQQWSQWAPTIPFIILPSPYRSVIEPLIHYIDEVEKSSQGKNIVTIIVPEFVTQKWWHALLHNQTAIFLRTALKLSRKKVITNVRYHLKS